MKKSILSLLLIATICSCKAPTKNGSDGGGSGGDNGGGDVGIQCGAVIDDKLESSVSYSDGIEAYVSDVFSANSLAIQEIRDDGSIGGDVLVKLQGIKDTPSSKRDSAITRINILTAGGKVAFIRAKEDCTAPVSGTTAIVGTIINQSGVSVNEELARTGLADIDTNDYCGGSLIAGCLQSIYGTTLETAGALDAFLWKPVSDSNGALAIHTGPYGTDVYVNGEKGQNQGSGNGYGSLARFSRPGCGYASPRIQVYDGSTGLPYTVGGSVSFTVPNPCGRNCLEGDTIQPCTK